MTAALVFAVIARSETTKQSSFLAGAKMDCFASARNDGMEAHGDPKLALGWCEAAVGGSIPHKGGTVTKGGGALPWIGSLLWKGPMFARRTIEISGPASA